MLPRIAVEVLTLGCARVLSMRENFLLVKINIAFGGGLSFDISRRNFAYHDVSLQV